MKRKIRFVSDLGSGRRLVIRQDGERTYAGILGMRDGQPLSAGAELLKIDTRCDPDGWHDVEVLYRHGEAEPERREAEPAEERSSSGPAQVATPEYRAGYDRIFGKQKVGVA